MIYKKVFKKLNQLLNEASLQKENEMLMEMIEATNEID
jgi:hypothetical protein